MTQHRPQKKAYKGKRRKKQSPTAGLSVSKSGGIRIDGVKLPRGAILADRAALEHNQSVVPDSEYPLVYLDRPFTCRGCGARELWSARQQQWWYEIAKGPIASVAVLCRPCRRKERERKSRVDQVRLAGLARKKQETS